MSDQNYSEEERNALAGIFSLYDKDQSGSIEVEELTGIMQKIGRSDDEARTVAQQARALLDDGGASGDGKITFEDFLTLLNSKPDSNDQSDQKVLEFLTILDEYRLKCEEEGNYLEAGRAYGQLETLRRQEERRQQKSLKARQIAERQDVQIAHNMQYSDFNQAWDKYMDEYDQMAQMYIQQMTEKHAVNLLEFQERLHKEVIDKPPKFSKELLEWRIRQHVLARNKNYAEAQKIKRIADVMEERELKSLDEMNRQQFARRETKFRAEQQAELQALLKRIDSRRKEHIKQRNLDSKRLLQRNRNVQSVLESKQSVEAVKTVAQIKANLAPKTVRREPVESIPDVARVKKQNRTKKTQVSDPTFITEQ